MFLKFFMDRRAVTPVLSNLLLMVVAVAAMSVAAATTYVITSNLRETMGERFMIEDVWFNSVEGVNRVSVYIRNTGKNAITISAVYINHTLQPTPKLKLEVGDHGWLNIIYDWAPNSLHHINVVTARGNRVEGYFKAP
ncbi:MAG: hypothetical protein NZ932_07450 [Candidatus Bathyarchaeota archaeon]|nr:hypothetical protein [Candidatus Bathyarchaeota archaeon]MDW8039845.1 hypothetical protein [Nitrososphaerota archaeon]